MNRTRTTVTLATSVVAAAGLAVGGATAATAAPATSAHGLNAADQAFMKANEQTNLAEMALGKIALKRATGPNARALAHRTIADHVKAQAKLKQVAKQDGVTLPTKPNATQLAAAQKLSKVNPHVALNYFTIQVAGHKLSVHQTKSELKKGSKPNVLAYAKYYLPVAEMHNHMAKADLAQLKSELNG